MNTSENEIITCAECGCIIEDDGVHEIAVRHDGEYICESCREDCYGECEECGELYNWDELHCIDNDEYICEDCLGNEDKFFYCEECGKYHRRYDRWGCERYYRRSGGGMICRDCADDYYICYDCGEVVRYDDATEIDDEWYCPDCAIRQRRAIHNYGYKPDPNFKTIHDVFFERIDPGNLYFGVELEVDNGNSRENCAGELVDASEDIYCKTDGSLNRGIEIVTHPCTLQYHTEVLPWKKLSQIAREYDFKSHETSTCGLHVHVGRAEMGQNYNEQDETAAKIVMLVVRHWENMVKFSRRKDGEMEEWAAKPKFDYGEDAIESVRNALETVDRGRYQAVNLKNEYTVEFRLFKGTLKRDTIIATLQLVNNIVNYAKNHPVDDVMKSQWEDVARYEQFKELDKYLKERDLREVEDIEPEKYVKTERIEVGDTVEVIMTNYSDRFLYGLYGKVIIVEEGDRTIGIDFGVQHSGFHTLADELEKRTGYWLPRKWVRLVKKGEKSECA